MPNPPAPLYRDPIYHGAAAQTSWTRPARAKTTAQSAAVRMYW